MVCDKITSEGRERFDISLTLLSNNSQVRTGSRDRSAVRITDSTGNDGSVVNISSGIMIK